jgi:FecR protein
MPNAHTFRLRNAGLLCALAAAFPVAVHASAGVAQFTSGPVSVNKAGAAAASLSKGGEVASGDTIVTGADGRAQLRFSDGGLVALTPNSQFKIENYADVNDGKADRFLVNLLQGGMRAITGLIGKRNRDNYKVQTATATIGIRGSGFSLAYNPDGTLSVTTELDGIEVCTTAGCIGLTAGESAIVKASDASPQRTNSRTNLPIPAPRREPQVVGDRTNAAGTSAGTFIALPTINPRPTPAPAPGPAPTPTPPPPQPATNQTQTGWAIRTADLLGPDPGGPPPPPGEQTLLPYAFRAADNGIYTSTATGTPVSYEAATQRFDWQTGVGASNDQRFSDTSVDPAAVSPFMVMGYRTPSAYLLDGEIEPGTRVSTFVTGAPSSAAGLTAMASAMPSARYNLVQATPVFSNNSEGQSTIAASLTPNSYVNVDFAGVGNYLDVNLNVLFTSGSLATADVTLRGSGSATGGTFGGTLATTSAACSAGTDVCTPGNFQGFFTGPAGAANFLGLTYGAGTGSNGRFAGAAVFGGDPQPIATPAAQLNYNFYNGYTDAAGALGLTNSFNAGGGSQPVFTVSAGQDLQIYSNSTGTTLTRVSPATGSRGSIGRYGDTEFLGWGYWDLTNVTNSSSPGIPNQLVKSLHFLTGSPATNLASVTGIGSILGTVNYTQYANTIPTFSSGLSQFAGTLNNAALTVDFTNIRVSASAQTTFVIAGTPYTQTMTATNMPLNVATGGFVSDPSNANNAGTINGFLSGNRGIFGGFVYGGNVNLGGNAGNINGVAIFRR